MKILLTFIALIFFSPHLLADSFICLTTNFENQDTYIFINKIDNDTYNFIQTFDINSDDFNEIPMQILQDTKNYLTLALAVNEMSITFHLDRKENYFEISHITLFVERELEKLNGVCQIN